MYSFKASFIQCNIFEIQPALHVRSSSFLMTAEWFSAVGICHSLLTRLPLDGHRGCFQFGAILTEEDMYISINTFQWTRALFLGMYLEDSCALGGLGLSPQHQVKRTPGAFHSNQDGVISAQKQMHGSMGSGEKAQK